MATFYILPSRLAIGQRFSEFLENLFPGLTWEHELYSDLAEALGEAARQNPEVYVLFREDLTGDGDVCQVLQDDFGAEEGDEIIEVPVQAEVEHYPRLAG